MRLRTAANLSRAKHSRFWARQAAPGLLIVVPGIRPSTGAGAAKGDQKRVATAAQAIGAGADYLVVGRPIRDAADPAAAFDGVVREIEIDRDDHLAVGLPGVVAPAHHHVELQKGEEPRGHERHVEEHRDGEGDGEATASWLTNLEEGRVY